jgi:hypothetical protein
MLSSFIRVCEIEQSRAQQVGDNERGKTLKKIKNYL